MDQEHDLTLRTDELHAELQGDIRVSILASGGRRFVNPSGVETIQTAEAIADEITSAEARLAEAQADLAAAQAVQNQVTAALAAAT